MNGGDKPLAFIEIELKRQQAVVYPPERPQAVV